LRAAVSKLSADTTEQSRDLKIASQAIRILLNKIDKVAATANDVADNLAHLRISVES
jgi:ABC-type metal ion transport system substrate-binding protein